MLSNRPYLLRAFYQWIVDSGCTPILVIDATNPHCQVPQEHVKDGEILFSIAPAAVQDLKITQRMVLFNASFSGEVKTIAAPVKAIRAVYAEENNEGLFFDADEEEVGDGGDSDPFGGEPAVILSVINNPTPHVNNESNHAPTYKPPVLKLVE